MEKEFKLNITIETQKKEEVKEWVKELREIQKEHSCNCTLNVVPSSKFQIDAKEFARQYHQALSDSLVQRERKELWKKRKESLK